MVIEVKNCAMAYWCYIASWGRTPWYRIPASLQEVVPSNAKREWKERKKPGKPYDPENKFKQQGPHSEVPVMYVLET